MAILIIAIPIGFKFYTEISFSALFSKMVLGAALLLMMAGKLLDLLNKRRVNKSIAFDIGIIVAMLILSIYNVLK